MITPKTFEVIIAGHYWQRVVIAAWSAKEAEAKALDGDFPDDAAGPLYTCDEFVTDVTEVQP
jgi:hypothetical protein